MGFFYVVLLICLFISSREWQNVRIKLQQHPDFNQYFLESPDEQPWQESDLVDSNETRIPLDILDSSEAEACFEEHKAALEAEERRKEYVIIYCFKIKSISLSLSLLFSFNDKISF